MHQKPEYSNLTGKCFINAPFERLQDDLLDLFITNHFQPEIGLEGNCLWEQEVDAFKKIAAKFQSRNLQCTLHAPFHDLVPGGFDSRIIDLSREKLHRAFALIQVFKPQSIVCHLGFEENKHGAHVERWLETSVATWSGLIKIAESAGTRVMFENTYETTPSVHKQLFEALESKNIGFCMDTGHLMAFAGTSWQPWLAELEPWLGQLHLHDNNGKGDDHIAVGEGVFDFHALFQHLQKKRLSPIVTLEPHTEQDLWLSLKNIKQMKILDDK